MQVTMIRQDVILPLGEHATKYRPNMPLLGMAIAPVLKSDPGHERWANERKIYRLWLHYMDHTILSYEISRQNNDALSVF
jgi:uracil-DNA glycosylase